MDAASKALSSKMSQPPKTRFSSVASGTKSFIFGVRLSVRFPRRIVANWVKDPMGADSALDCFHAREKRGAHSADAWHKDSQLPFAGAICTFSFKGRELLNVGSSIAYRFQTAQLNGFLRAANANCDTLRYTNILMQNGATSKCAGAVLSMTLRTSRTISAVLVDDEKLASDELSYQLRDFPDIEVLATASNGLEAVKLIEDLQPDLVFLDVQMPGLDGMGVIRRLRELDVPLPYFIMATAFDQYAVEAFRWEALDYLLKPVEKERLSVALERARKSLVERERTVSAEAVPSKPALQRTKILIRHNQRNFIVDTGRWSTRPSRTD